VLRLCWMNCAYQTLFRRCFKTFFYLHTEMQVRLFLSLLIWIADCTARSVSVGTPSERMSNIWTVWFLKSESEPIFGFPHIPSSVVVVVNCVSELQSRSGPVFISTTAFLFVEARTRAEGASDDTETRDMLWSWENCCWLEAILPCLTSCGDQWH